ncbi:COMM domain-containing protein 9-like isoform X2 [Gasterosteus aculeatus]
MGSAEQILRLFPDSFHSSLKNLITKILLENSPTWRTEALRDQNGGPMSVGGHRAGFHGDGGADPGRIRDQLSVVAAK